MNVLIIVDYNQIKKHTNNYLLSTLQYIHIHLSHKCSYSNLLACTSALHLISIHSYNTFLNHYVT